MRTETTIIEDAEFGEPIWHETPAEFVARSGLGADRAWQVWNRAQAERGNYDAVLSRDRFRKAVRGEEF